MIALIVLGSIVAYLLAGTIILRPALGAVYAAVQSHLAHGYSWNQNKADDPNAILPYVTAWYTAMVLIWPLAGLWTMVWLTVRHSTPQYVEHQAKIEQKRLSKELAEANRVIAEFSKRDNATEQKRR